MSTVTAPALAAAGTAPDAAAPAEETCVDRLARRLAENLAHGTGGTITWLNHYSALRALQAGVALEEFDYLGLDGIFLCRLVGVEGAACRTSADLLLPRLLEQTDDLRIALIGSRHEALLRVADKLAREYGHRVVLMRDGYSGLPELPTLRRELQASRAQLVIVGLGTPLQDRYALGLRSRGVLVATCGGWLDQFSADSYYPSWAYPLRLNWLVRLAKEPRRLWRRYSLDAVRALRARTDLVDYITVRGGRPLSAALPTTAPTALPVA